MLPFLVVLAATHILAAFAGEQSVLTEEPWSEGRLPILPGKWTKPLQDLEAQRHFTLRQVIHRGAHRYPNTHRYAEVSASDEEGTKPSMYAIGSTTTSLLRMRDRSRSTVDGLLNYASLSGIPAALSDYDWSMETTSAPDTEEKTAIISLAKMAADAYAPDPSSPEWQDVGKPFNVTDDFGWEMDGLRGHVFADQSNTTVVLAIKGTSMAIFEGTETEPGDKINDNLFASCCCGEGQYRWKRVCDCKTDTYTCNSTCLVQSLRQKDHYYNAARDLYHNVTERYTGADIWLVGHSLGGVVSSLLGQTYGLPVVTFEAYPDALAASRLGLPTPPGYRIGGVQPPTHAIHHFGHTADPVFMGTCNTWSSTCSIAGYAMESSCHTGKVCRYDTVGDLGWRSSVRTHSIVTTITDVYEKYDRLPNCTVDADCVDCFQWKYFESNSSDPSASTSSSSVAGTSTGHTSRTRTETCKTPGWWGCRDQTSTTTRGVTSTSGEVSATTTTSCKTPGWFGCKDATTTTITTTMEMEVTALAAPVVAAVTAP